MWLWWKKGRISSGRSGTAASSVEKLKSTAAISSDAYTILSRRIGKSRGRNGRMAGVAAGETADQNSQASSATVASLSADDAIIVDTRAVRCASLDRTAG